MKGRPITPVELFEKACEEAGLSNSEQKIIEYIRYKGTFTQPELKSKLKLDSKPPAMSVVCNICRKIGSKMPDHFSKVREWSKQNNEYGIKWDGDLICSLVLNVDGEKLTPENGTAQYHTFVVHKELFQGLE